MIIYWLIRPPRDNGDAEQAKEVINGLEDARQEAASWAKQTGDTIVICKQIDSVQP